MPSKISDYVEVDELLKGFSPEEYDEFQNGLELISYKNNANKDLNGNVIDVEDYIEFGMNVIKDITAGA